ncbi:CHH-like protein isoform X2 [Adelges cooleyi]|uniref:CHH-like protein isoform X2 n=1 Tax=Adelges cooleyi TaxID=133065 RepID=UPI002180897C|nr:CHH-like protein isoform X2 [Adelges cooleyi]
MPKYGGGFGFEPALVLVATLVAIMAVSVVAVPAAHHLHHHGHRMGAGSSSGIEHPLSKRSFFDIQCKGVYDKTIFARLDRVCEDCYNLFREPQLHSLCRSTCFNTVYFKACLESLQLLTEETQYNQMVDFLGKK